MSKLKLLLPLVMLAIITACGIYKFNDTSIAGMADKRGGIGLFQFRKTSIGGVLVLEDGKHATARAGHLTAQR